MQDKDWVATPEITTSMLEVATSILDGYAQAAAQIEEIRASVQRAAFQVGAAISGGGAHPFQKWNEQRIYPKERYRESARKFGYLAKLFTVFGMHVHIGVPERRRGDPHLRLADPARAAVHCAVGQFALLAGRGLGLLQLRAATSSAPSR